MSQETSLPDPAQLRAWAKEMVPFTELDDLKIGKQLGEKDDYLYGLGDVDHEATVEYQFRPTNIKVETGDGEYTPTSEAPAFDHVDHERAWHKALDVERGEDYVCATFVSSGYGSDPRQVEAYWVLETTRVTRHTA